MPFERLNVKEYIRKQSLKFKVYYWLYGFYYMPKKIIFRIKKRIKIG